MRYKSVINQRRLNSLRRSIGRANHSFSKDNGLLGNYTKQDADLRLCLCLASIADGGAALN